ncbi:hypothetical protein BSPLISOX_643 [uncultured Gammaproteobacteria bacterium]|nr:hypothetical protein [uncultured Gammaproteobacteria bacterium]CAC9435699.1 hypothetical protein [uncultured Gammaproteobacteria bacterium]VVH66487.1 hypothetical protein BSPLISOX_643 [uncultured Gammaproteobacteria bacterium]
MPYALKQKLKEVPYLSFIKITILSSAESGNIIQLKTGIFSRKVLAGCVCSDDVSQAINDENGYCELQVKLDKDTNKLEITL